MGYIKHNAVIVTSWDEKYAKKAHEKAREIYASATDGLRKDFSQLVGDLVPGIVNGQYSFFIAPDGSKEGWETSTVSDNARKEFFDWIKSNDDVYCECIDIRFGGDDNHEYIADTNNEMI